MEYCTIQPRQEISESGILYDLGSLYARFEQLGDPRHAHGKRYRLTTLFEGHLQEAFTLLITVNYRS